MASLTDDQYFAGLWKGDLVEGLLWNTQGKPPTKAPSQYRAPSWSWAAMNGPIVPGSMMEIRSGTKFSFEILEAGVDVLGHDPMGHVSGGRLKVSGLMKQLTSVVECEGDDRWFYANRAPFPYDLMCEDVKICEGRLDLDDISVLRGELWYLDFHTTRPSGLVLERISATSDEFRRVGTAKLTDVESNLFYSSCILDDCKPRIITII